MQYVDTFKGLFGGDDLYSELRRIMHATVALRDLIHEIGSLEVY